MAIARALQWLPAWALPERRRRSPEVTGVQIHDLLGRLYFASAMTRPLIDVRLPAGTYHVTVERGSLRRRYTLTLAHGATVHLVQGLAHDRP
jgi:hypothetical protein